MYVLFLIHGLGINLRLYLFGLKIMEHGLESDTVMDFVPITAPLPSMSYRSHYRSRDIIPVTVTVPVALSPLPLPYFYYYFRSRFCIQFDESNVCSAQFVFCVFV